MCNFLTLLAYGGGGGGGRGDSEAWMTILSVVILKALTVQSSNLLTASFNLLGTFRMDFVKIDGPGGCYC